MQIFKYTYKYKPFTTTISLLASVSLLTPVISLQSHASGAPTEDEEIIVTARGIEHLKPTEAASVGTVLAQQIENRPILRPAEILEMIPGMVVTQHSGGGKANQYFLRGFSLDHSTDFANYFEGAPVNMVSHGHGQGYSDFNFLIPEMLDRMVYNKGPYYASQGNFSSAGSAQVFYAREKDSNQLKFTAGEDGYLHALLHGGYNQGEQHWVYSLARTEDDGPWENPDNLERDNAFVKYSKGEKSHGFSLSAMYFNSSWNGTDQIPQRLVNDGTLGRFGTLDDSAGGDTHRYQLSYEQRLKLSDTSRIKANAYLIDYALSLSSNFTYYTGDLLTSSVIPGVPANEINDQITQFDDRKIFGGSIEWQQQLSNKHELSLGSDLRIDDISDVGIGQSYRRTLYSFSSKAGVDERALGLHGRIHSQWSDWFTSVAGLRYDFFDIDVDDNLNTSNSGSTDDALISPKLSLRFGPFNDTQIFLNFGKGFHSNDARGVIIDEVPLLSESTGYELGLRSSPVDHLQLSFVLFQLNLDSELVFVGDEGTTEPKDASRRQGIELSAYYHPSEWFVLDADYTKSQARFKNDQLDGNVVLGDNVPDSIEDVFSMGVSANFESGLYLGLRLRYFGPRNLTEGASIQSSSSSTVSANIGHRFASGFALGLEILNLTDREDDDITYWYASRTQEERDNNIEAIDDFHSHTMIPRTLRATISYEF